MVWHMSERKKNVLTVFLVHLIFSILFYRSHTWFDTTPFSIKIRTYIVCLILVVLLPLLAYFWNAYNAWVGKIRDSIHEAFLKIKHLDRKAVLFSLVQYGIGALVAWIIGHAAAFALHLKLNNWDYNVVVYWCCFTASVVLITFWKLRKIAAKNVEKVFFVITLIVGIFFISASPVEVGISWDDEIHYQRTMDLLDYFEGHGYQVEELQTMDYQMVAGPHYGYAKEERAARNKALNQSFSQKKIAEQGNDISMSSFAYLPYCVGFIIARGLSLSYTFSFRLAKLINYLFYISFVYFALKKLRSGKVLMATIACFPTALYLAGSFSYDPWIIALSMYGFATFFGILQKEEEVKTSELIKMLVSLGFAFIIKAVYFPALFPLLFIPKKKFHSKKQHTLYIIGVFALAIGLASTFVLPMLFGGGASESGDARGGDGVNTAGQIQFILSNPYQFTKIMAKFLFKDYLAPFNAAMYIQNYAYMSFVYQPPFYEFSVMLFFFVAMYDQDGLPKKTKGIVISGIFGAFCAILLVATALYLSYTPVGYETVNGCQFRYLLPLVFPVSYLISTNYKITKKNENLFVIIPLLILVATFVFWTGGNLYAGYSNFLF